MENIWQHLEASWAHLDLYTNLELAFFGLGMVFWIIAYQQVINGIRRWKLVEMPMVVAALDLSWEFDWAFVLPNDLGLAFNFGCAAWFIMDCYINFYTLRYGRKLVTNPWIKQNYVLIYLFILIGGGFITYSMKENAADNGMGIVSAYFVNLMISSLYLYQLISWPELRNRGFSPHVAWSKFLGTGCMSIGCALHWGHNSFLMTMCALVAVMDFTYLYLFRYYRPVVGMPAPVVEGIQMQPLEGNPAKAS